MEVLNSEIKYDLLNIPEFKEIIKNGTKDSLRNLIVTDVSYNGEQYKIIKYEKALLSKELISTYGLCRSIIIGSEKEIKSFSPPKSVDTETFIKNNPIITENIIAEEFLEGTMINLFWNKISWEITTRNVFGANTSFTKPITKTFRDMFFEAVEMNKIQMNELNKKICYSFVLQHPENKIVLSIKTPQLYLVGMYGINNYVITSYNVHCQTEFNKTGVKLPKIIEFKTYSELIKEYASMNSPYTILGVMIYNKKTGERCKLRNPVYEEIKLLKGNQAKLQYQYLCLRKERKVSEYLKYFPENKSDFSFYRDTIHLFTDTLFKNYVECFIKKEKPLIEYPPQYKQHMYKLHQIYINSINAPEYKDKKFYINKQFVINYVNELHPSQLMYSLNYHLKKRNVDIINTEKELEEDFVML